MIRGDTLAHDLPVNHGMIDFIGKTGFSVYMINEAPILVHANTGNNVARGVKGPKHVGKAEFVFTRFEDRA